MIVDEDDDNNLFDSKGNLSDYSARGGAVEVRLIFNF